MVMTRRIGAAMATALILAGLAGCAQKPDYARPCPVVTMVPDAAFLTRFAGDPEFDRVAARLAAAAPVARRGRTVATVAVPGLVPEGVAADPGSGRLFLGDMNNRRIWAIASDGGVRPFGAPLVLRPLDPLGESFRARGEAGEPRGTERRRLDHRGTLDRGAEHVGLELHQPVVLRHPAVHAQRHAVARRGGSMSAHQLHDVPRRVRHGLQCRASQVRASGSARESDDRAARPRLPVRRAEAGERRHEVHAVVRRDRSRERLRVR